ncbi:MAG: hypothetical protein ABSG17_05680 [Spirochaetia bacterium]|jgi:hypothetical protein
MRKLVLAVIVLLALFSLFRAYSQSNGESSAVTGLRLQPGLIEVGDGTASLGLSFGIMEKSGVQRRLVSVLPLRVVYRSGDRNVSVGLNGISFLVGGGSSIGMPVVVSSLRRGDLLSVGGRVTVDSRVEGDVWALGADVELTPRAVVTGDVVAIGGKVTASPGAAVGGTVSQLAGMRIPFLGILGTQFSAQSLGLAGVALGYVLLGFALFLCSFYLAARTRDLQQAMPTLWRQALVTLAISLIVIPLVTLLLIASLVGVFLLPLLALVILLLSLDGFLGLSVRTGAWLRGAGERAGSDPLFLFTSGLLALFLVIVPALVGVLLTALRSAAAAKVGTALQALTLGLTAAGLAYGFGTSLAFTRTRAAK